MNNEPWSFSDFVRWLSAKSETLRGLGAAVEFHVNDASRASVRLRVKHGQRLGELTVWEDGTAHMAVVDLASGDFVFERDGVSLAHSPSSSELNGFFERLETAV